MPTYLFYDIETTGLNKAFDQVLRFAAIRTDETFREVDRHSVSVRLRPDVVISPGAMIVSRISIGDAAEGLSEYEAMLQIHQWLNASGTISLGYNTLGFDDEFLRFSFHRNLLPPYTHQYGNGCRRMDMLPFAVIYRLYCEDALVWPEVNGKPTLKLEHLNRANQLAPGRSHDAMADVEATVALAGKLAEKRKIWEFLAGCFDKKTDGERLADLPEVLRSSAGSHRKGVLVSHEMGKENLYQAPVLSLGNSIPYSNQTLWLRLDLPELRKATPETIPDMTWVVRKKLGEPPIVLPPLDRYWQRLSEERRETAAENLSWLSGNPDLFRGIVEYHRQYRYPEIPDLDADAALYQMGFLSSIEESLCRRFHAAPLQEKTQTADRFPKPETKALARRILLRNFPEAAGGRYQDDWNRYLSRVNPLREEEALVDYRGRRRTTPTAALAEINRIRQEDPIDDEQQRLLSELEAYLISTFIRTRPTG